jgi:phosphonoacetaldehyde hydrolase
MERADVDHLYLTFIPLQVERVGAHADLIPGTLETVAALRAQGLKIGSTTGYPREVMLRLIEEAAQRGYAPDCVVCADDLAAGARPGPWMALDCVQQLRIGAVAHCVKVDDTLPGLLEGRSAGMWTVGLALSGSPAGWTLDEYQAAPEAERELVRARVRAEFAPAQPHYVIDSVADLLPALAQIERRLAAGERP